MMHGNMNIKNIPFSSDSFCIPLCIFKKHKFLVCRTYTLCSEVTVLILGSGMNFLTAKWLWYHTRRQGSFLLHSLQFVIQSCYISTFMIIAIDMHPYIFEAQWCPYILPHLATQPFIFS